MAVFSKPPNSTFEFTVDQGVVENNTRIMNLVTAY